MKVSKPLQNILHSHTHIFHTSIYNEHFSSFKMLWNPQKETEKVTHCYTFTKEVAHLIISGACQFHFTLRHRTALVLNNKKCLIYILSLSDKKYSVVDIDTFYDMSFYYVISFLNKLLKTKPGDKTW